MRTGNPEIATFSGTAVYRATITLPSGFSTPGSSLRLEIRVVNSWHNRLLADQRRPKDERKTFTVRPPNADATPVASGLIGPVEICREQ